MSKINDAIQQMTRDKMYASYFFKNCLKYQKLHLWLEPLYKIGFFNPKNNSPVVESSENSGSYYTPQWEILEFLEAVAIQNEKIPQIEVTDKLLFILNAIINYTNKGKRIDNYRTDWFIVKILFLLPYQKVTKAHINFIEASIRESRLIGLIGSDLHEVVLPVLVQYQLKGHLIELLFILFGYEVNERLTIKERQPIIEEYWLNETLKIHSKNIINIIKLDGLIKMIEIIEKILAQDESAFNIIWIVTIENHSQNSFPDRLDNQIISFTRDLLEIVDPNSIKEKIGQWIKSNCEIFNRLAFHTIKKHYIELKDIFWDWFRSEYNKIEYKYKHEFYELLDKKSDVFTINEINEVIDWVENLDYSEIYNNEKDQEVIKKKIAYKKKEWLLTLEGHNTRANKLYNHYNKLNPYKIDHPGFDIWSSGVITVDNNPLKDIDFDNMTATEISDKIKNFTPSTVERKDLYVTDQDCIENLSRKLGYYIQKKPNKIINNLDEFVGLDKIYLQNIIYGFRQAWKEKQKFNWGRVFSFILEISDNSFLDSDDEYTILCKKEIADLINEGTCEDINAFDQKYLPKAKEILFKLIDNKIDDDVSIDNLFSYTLNTVNGKVLRALISYALRYGRLNSNQEVKWEKGVKDFFTNQLDKDNRYSLYVFSILGEYYRNFLFLDKNWVVNNFDKIFSKDKDHLWEVSYSSYIKFSSIVYTDIFLKFKVEGSLQKALNFPFQDNHISEKVIQQICVMYMNNRKVEKSEEESFIFEVIRSYNFEKTLDIIKFIWRTYKGKEKQIYTLWKVIYEKCISQNTNDLKILSTLSKWFKFIIKINDENIEWFKLSAKYSKDHVHSHLILESMQRLVDKNANFVSQIFLEMLNNGILPWGKVEDIKVVLIKLRDLGERESVVKIINIFSNKGDFSYIDIIRE